MVVTEAEAGGDTDAAIGGDAASVVDELSTEVLQEGGLDVLVTVCVKDCDDTGRVLLLLLDALETVTTSFFSVWITGGVGPMGGLNDVYKLD